MSETNLAESMSEIYDEIMAKGEETEETTEEVETEEAEEPTDEPVDESEASEPEPEAEDSEPEAEEVEALDPGLELAPTGWDTESKSKYAELPAWAKKQLHKREQDAIRGVNQLKDQIKASEGLTKAAEPYKAFLNSRGITMDKVVSDSLNLAYSLATGTPQQKAGILANMARQYGVDLGMVSKPDPQALQQEQLLQPVLNKVQRLEQELFKRQEREREQSTTQALSSVEAFATETDEKGQLKHPYLERVQDVMVDFLETGWATTLQDAYEKAVWSDPDIRTLMQQKQLAEQEAKRQAEAKERAAKAKKSNRTNLNKRGQHDSSEKKPTGSVRDTLNETYERITA